MNTDRPGLESLESRLGHVFGERDLLVHALTHTSYRNESTAIGRDNERFEFLGDAVLGAVISHDLVMVYPDSPEGVLSRYKAILVSERGLHQVALELDLGTFMWLGRGEEMSGGREKISLLSNTMEAVIAAVYLDAGFAAAQALIRRLFSTELAAIESSDHYQDFKTRLQEWVQEQHGDVPQYQIVGERGPDHAKVFEAAVIIAGNTQATGTGRSKKEAEQSAARQAYATMTSVSVPE